MNGFDIGFGGAALAGLLSFVSPCVLPLVPPYLCFIAGVSLEQLSGEQQQRGPQWRVFTAALFFVFGFATVFVALGATASTLGHLIAGWFDVLAKVAGALIIILGLHFTGILKWSVLYRELRFHNYLKPGGLVGAYVVGLAFAFGWTPCVGPVLAAVLFVAGSEESVLKGAALLAAYAAGIGLPFLAVALVTGPSLRLMNKFKPYLHRIEQAMGVILVITGILFITGSVNELGYWLQETFPSLGQVG